MTEISGTHTIQVENCGKATLTGILSVENFNEKQVQVKTALQNSLIISGENLNVNKFNTENGTLTVEGVITNVKYYENKSAAGIIKKIFK